MAGKLTFDALKKVVEGRLRGKGFESIFSELKVLSGSDGECKCELKVSAPMLNVRGSMHGGVSASLIDAVSKYALMTIGTGASGMSLDLNISFLKPVFKDDLIVVEAKTLSYGKTFAVASVDITKAETGQLVTHGTHSKFMGQAFSS